MATKIITDATFKSEVLQSDKPVLLDFYADWCGPCKMIAPALDELSDEMADQVVIAKIDGDENVDTLTKLGVRGFPTFVIFKNGEKVASQAGVQNVGTKSRMKAWIESAI